MKQLEQIDIGLYPVEKNNWSLGKGGLKILQYMSLGIASVADNFGMSKHIIKKNYDGILVNNDYEWYKALLKLLTNKNFKKKITINARKKIEKKYSVEVNKNKYLKIFTCILK